MPTALPPPPAPARRQPAQQRSQERRERILAVATQLIAQKGSEPLKMSEIAQQAEISIGSLYQYFPDKRSVVRTLAERLATENRRCIADALAGVQDEAGLVAAFSGLVDDYHALMCSTPVMRDIHAGLRADKELVPLELAESQACAALLASAILRVFPDADAKRVGVLAFLVWQLGEETFRLALSQATTEEGRLLVDAYRRMSLQAIVAP